MPVDSLILEMIDTMDDQVDEEAEEIMDAEDDLVYGDSDGDMIDVVSGNPEEDQDDYYPINGYDVDDVDLDYDDDEDDYDHEDDDCGEEDKNTEDDEYIKNGICPKCGELLIDCTCGGNEDEE